MSENFFEDLEQIAKTYDKFEFENKPKDVNGCFFKPTPCEVLIGEVKLLKILEQKKLISNDKTILLAGSGDGRRAAYLNRSGYNVYAIEINNILYQKSVDILTELSKNNLLDKSKKLRIINGSFLEDSTYNSNSLKFNDFNKIFTYLLPNNTEKLIKKIEKESNKTELFILTKPDFKDPDTKSLEKTGYYPLIIPGVSHFYLDTYKKN